MYALRMNFDLIDCGNDSGNINYSLRLENVKIGKTCVDNIWLDQL